MRKTLNTKKTLEFTGIRSATTLKNYCKAGTFPKPIQYGSAKNSPKFWFEDELIDWRNGRRQNSA